MRSNKIKISAFVIAACVLMSLASIAQNSDGNFDDRYPKKSGALRFSKLNLIWGEVYNNQVKIDTIRLFNSSAKAMNIGTEGKTPDYLQLVFSESNLSPGAESYLVLKYDFSKRDEFGFVLDRLIIKTDDAEMPLKNINITASIREYFPPKESGDSIPDPKVFVAEKIVDFGKVKAGDKLKKEILIQNTGGKILKIHRAKTSCGCLTLSVSKSEIEPGASAVLNVEFNSFAKSGAESYFFNVYFNDPMNSDVKFEVKADVWK
ncbi:MAG: DUF1573 domain-containing protein [Bacteroidetes bacterium]|nr:MAG: DUF1573 domain-containing protein [Bacteroidota bacterium]REK07059.1 MAG: DUF1573 domain-containing protein [Bacteroidota bacterium]REK33595.1 MAG: DUF1573 domain-containing protein [Bacteroidota bacterium]REK48579.1 MAG: DUF1573 domain-containing protein [Bacteroidota bacterium]